MVGNQVTRKHKNNEVEAGRKDLNQFLRDLALALRSLTLGSGNFLNLRAWCWVPDSIAVCFGCCSAEEMSHGPCHGVVRFALLAGHREEGSRNPRGGGPPGGEGDSRWFGGYCKERGQLK